MADPDLGRIRTSWRYRSSTHRPAPSLWRANLTDADAVGTGTGRGTCTPAAIVPDGGGDLHPVTFPVFDGTALSGNNAARLRRRQRRRRGVPEGRGDGASRALTGPGTCPSSTRRPRLRTARRTFYCTWDKTVAQRLEAEPGLVRRPALSLPEQRSTITCWPPRSGSPKLPATSRSRTRRARAQDGDAVEGHAHRRGQHRERVPRRGPCRTTRTSRRRSDGRPGDHADVPAARGDLGLEASHPATRATRRRPSTTNSPTACPTAWSPTPDGIPALNAQQSGSMGEGWSDWYAIDYTDNHGWFFDTPTSGDAIVFRYSARRRGVLPHRGGRLPGRRRPRENCPVQGVRQRPGRVHVRRLRQDRQASPRCTPTARSGCRPCGRCASSSDPQ